MSEYSKILNDKGKEQEFNLNSNFDNDHSNSKNSSIIKKNKYAENKIYFNNYNKNDLYEQTPSSFKSKYNNLGNNYQRHSENLSNNMDIKTSFDIINSHKEIIYNFGYKKEERLEPLKLSLIRDTLTPQKQKNQNKIREKELSQKKDEIYENIPEKKTNSINGSNSLNPKINNSINFKKDEYLSKMVEQELNLTNRQMNMLDKEVNIIYNNYKGRINEKNKLLKINEHLKFHKFLSNQNIRIIKNNIHYFKKNKNKFHVNSKKEIKVPISLLMPYKIDENSNNNYINNYYKNKKQNYFLSPLAQKGFHFFQNINNKYINFNSNNEEKKLTKNYSQIFEGKKYLL